MEIHVYVPSSKSETSLVVKWLACSPRVWYVVRSSPDRVKPMTMKLVLVASPLGT